MDALPYLNQNGKIVSTDPATVSIQNSALRYGLGLLETILVREGEIQLMEFHTQRLLHGLKQLQFEIPDHFVDPLFLQKEILEVVRANKAEKLCRVRLQTFAESAETSRPEFMIECFEIDQNLTELNEDGWTVGIAEGIFKSNDELANLKTSNGLLYIMAARKAKGNNWQDALITNANGNIIESSIANIFWIKGGTIHTPPLSEGCIAGVMRRHVLEEMRRTSYSVIETPLTEDELFDADEIFLTNAIRRIKWVKEVGSKLYSDKLTREIYSKIFS